MQPSEASAGRSAAFRILDANLNRLREALRVVEEYFRFAASDPALAVRLKEARHRLEAVEAGLDKRELLAARDTSTDPFSGPARPEELARTGIEDVAWASLKRGQEAARVLEEYVKVLDKRDVSERAKEARFLLYGIEKLLMERMAHG